MLHIVGKSIMYQHLYGCVMTYLQYDTIWSCDTILYHQNFKAGKNTQIYNKLINLRCLLKNIYIVFEIMQILKRAMNGLKKVNFQGGL